MFEKPRTIEQKPKYHFAFELDHDEVMKIKELFDFSSIESYRSGLAVYPLAPNVQDKIPSWLANILRQMINDI